MVIGMRTKRFRMFLWGAALAAMLLAAPGGFAAQVQGKPEAGAPVEAADTRTLVDLAGRRVVIPARVNRVASLTGPSFETVIMLGEIGRAHV